MKLGDDVWKKWEDHGALEIASGFGMCDFCTMRPPQQSEWVYPCESFMFPVQYPGVAGGRPQRSEGDWGACKTCAHLIENNKRKALAKRCPRLYEAGVQSLIVKAFFEHRKWNEPRYRSDQPFVVFDEAIIMPE